MLEKRLMEDLGVRVQYGKALGTHFTVKDLKKEGYEAVFLGFGLPEAKKIKVNQKAGRGNNIKKTVLT